MTKSYFFIRKLEIVIRRNLYFFFTFYICYFLTYTIYPTLFTYKVLSIPVYIPLFILVSVPVTIFMRDEIKRNLEESSWYIELQEEEYEQIRSTLKYVWILAFYFLIQCGIVAVFFPKIGLITYLGIPVLLVVSIVNCFPIFLFYKKFIFLNHSNTCK